ncbi:minichromosome maintenance protein MCM [Candidatus Micrarchaeota archaeon]|nr:minichromosome maintenance protein MCM [Candidatus Micrarchaeota archaeon]
MADSLSRQLEHVDISSIIQEFQEFFNMYYKKEIEKLVSVYPKNKSLNIDYQILERFNSELADKLINEPDLVIYSAKNALIEMNYTLLPNIKFKPHVRFYNLPKSDLLIENISSQHINKLISVKGVVTKRAEVKHKVHVATYQCAFCGEKTKIVISPETEPPSMCPSCKRKGGMVLLEDESEFVDIQRAEVQELLERLKGGTPPARLELWLEDDLVNSIIPGDTLEMIGILRLRQPYVPRGRKKVSFVYTRYLDILHVTKQKKEFEEIVITDDDKKEILNLSKSQNLYERMVKSIAPAIYGHHEIKEGILLQLFGGTPDKMLPSGGRIRDDIHILLIGDPGAAKSRMLQYVTALAPKSVYVSGKSVTGVGLTASAERDELADGGWTLKAGALVLSSGGIAAIDEFDKIDQEERASLHEAMESGQISIAKAGIVATMKSKTSILAAANPKFGRFDPERPLADQFNIPSTLLSRFDLIYPMIDVPDEEKDSNIADTILRTHQEAGKGVITPKDSKVIDEDVIPNDLMKKYIAYARQHVKPTLSEDAMDKIKSYYLKMREMGKQYSRVAITARQIEGLIRLTEASAKVRLASVAEADDAERAIKLVDWMMRKLAMDKEVGSFDIDTITSGRSRSQFEKFSSIIEIVKELQKNYDKVEIKRVIKEAEENYGISPQEANRIIQQLITKGDLYKPEHGIVKLVGED